MEEKYILQNRWKIIQNKLVYYGLRQKPNINKNKISISKKTKDILLNLEKTGIIKYTKEINRLIDEEILVKESQKKVTPKSFDEAIFCKNCIANDFMIPGIEFDNNGLCPMCANKEFNDKIKSVMPIMKEFKKSKKSRFDVAVFYTGGKDSTYLLYYFAKVLNLRVLALTWEIPFMSDNARESILNAKKYLRNVEFVNRFLNPVDMKTIYNSLYHSQQNTCCCPNLAYILFYPLLVTEKVPYLVIGNEPVQMKGLYYNNIAPKIAYNLKLRKILKYFINITRILTLRLPLKDGQFEMLKTMKQLAYGNSKLTKLVGYENEILENIDKSLKLAPRLQKNLKGIIRTSSFFRKTPSLVHVDFNDIAKNGIYDWQDVKELLVREVGFIPPASKEKLLHTSCAVEVAKDYSQFICFYNMQTRIIPFSALEISLSVAYKNTSREDAIKELKENLGFSLIRPISHEVMEKCNGCSITKL